MTQDELKEIFNNQAEGYDSQWSKTSPIREGLLFLLEFIFADLPEEANILCVGAGTGEEIVYLAKRFPKWSFTAVEPSEVMLKQIRVKAEREGFISRCRLHGGYLNSMDDKGKFDAATCFLVSHFLLDQKERIEFFREIAVRLKPGGILASSDLSSDINSAEFEANLRVWLNILSIGGANEEAINKMRQAYTRDVAVLPSHKVEEIIKSAGFTSPIKFYQSVLIKAWFSKRAH